MVYEDNPKGGEEPGNEAASITLASFPDSPEREMYNFSFQSGGAWERGYSCSCSSFPRSEATCIRHNLECRFNTKWISVLT